MLLNKENELITLRKCINEYKITKDMNSGIRTEYTSELNQGFDLKL